MHIVSFVCAMAWLKPIVKTTTLIVGQTQLPQRIKIFDLKFTNYDLCLFDVNCVRNLFLVHRK
jgi:hypothetical protein